MTDWQKLHNLTIYLSSLSFECNRSKAVKFDEASFADYYIFKNVDLDPAYNLMVCNSRPVYL